MILSLVNKDRLVIGNRTSCPSAPESDAEAYVMRMLPARQATAFEKHNATCDLCAWILLEAAEYIEAMRAAEREMRAEENYPR